MSKVLIDRELLERVQERLDPHRDAVLWGAVCDTFRSATSGTPAMPVKAYYHEWTDLEGVRTRSVGLEVRKEFTDAPLVLESDAMARIACLEGEIAKRDARIVELESQYQRDVFGLNNEGDPIGGDPAGGYANDNARLRAELYAIKAQEPVQVDYVAVMRADGDGGLEVEWLLEGGTAELMSGMYLCCVGGGTLLFEEGSGHLYAAPVSEARAQGVVQWPDADEIMQMAFEEGQPADDASGYCFELEEFDLFIERLMSEVARLNVAPVQQVSVPASAFASRAITHYEAALLAAFPSGSSGEVFNQWNEARRVLAAAPAAPAADAGIVDMYRHLQKVTPYRFKKIQDASITDGGDVMYFHKDRFDAALLDDMAAHCAAKGGGVMRTHFNGRLGGGDDDDVEQAACGTWLGEASNLSGDWGRVDCALCLKRKTRITDQHEAEERAIVEQMGDMAAFMKRNHPEAHTND